MLTLDSVAIAFSGRSILRGVSTTVKDGETVGIIGPNGSGKTTLFNCISGFTPCDRGTITFQGEQIERLPPHERARRGIGRVFQNFGIFREMTVEENILIALESKAGARPGWVPWSNAARALRREARERLGEFNLTPNAGDPASSLSGGQLRLLEIARTLAGGAALLLLDEPTAGVSPRMREGIIDGIKRVQAAGKTVLIIEHDITFIERFCSRILVLNEGRIELDGTPEAIRADERLQSIYFGRAPTPGR